MKLLIVSDIHGSLYYANKLKEAFEIHKCSNILLLGDLLYHGPRNPLPKDYSPKDIIPLLNNLKEHIIAVRGNCDSEVDQMVLEFPITADYTTIIMEDYKIFASHGHLFNPENLPALNENDVFIFGHIHIPIMEKINGIHIINPSSISLPKNDNPHTYGIIENKVFYLYNDEHQQIAYYKF